jgi:tetratricopeptide (TPR) repeat protein
LRVVPSLLADPDPLVRIAALGMVEATGPAARLALAAPLLTDAVRGVRVEAARILADLPDDRFQGEAGRDRERALQEYVGSLQLNADWPDANVNLGNLYRRQGRMPEAQAAFERAVFLDPHFAGAYANLADLYRQQSRELDAEEVLYRGLAVLPRAPELHHALGLLLVRKSDRAAAIDELREAVKLAPDNSRYAYVYAIGLHGAGRRDEALVVLREFDARHPYNLEILDALISMNREAGDAKAALAYARKLAEALPDDAGVKRLVHELAGAQ